MSGNFHVVGNNIRFHWLKFVHFIIPFTIAEGVAITESSDTITQFSIYSYKLASLKNSFVADTAFDIEDYLLNAFARRFGRAEETALLNGTGVNQPTGLMSDAGAETGVTQY